jgi:hypothetical protein
MIDHRSHRLYARVTVLGVPKELGTFLEMLAWLSEHRAACSLAPTNACYSTR